MNDFPSNFGDKTLCTIGCLEILNSEHVTMCPGLTNKWSNSLEYKKQNKKHIERKHET